MLLVAVVLFATFSRAQRSEVYIANGYAVNGYDVVSYFTESKPVKGTKNYLYQWHDSYWLFSSKQNLDSFSHDPEKYAPQFGGYCAYGLSEGHKAPTQFDAWTIIDNKLYLNYNTDVKALWIKDTDTRIKKANENWLLIKDKE